MPKSSEKNTQRTVFDQNFWKNFSQKTWEKKSAHFKNIQSPLAKIGEQEIFEMLVDFADLCRKKKSADGFKLFLKGEKQHPLDVLQFLPEKKDLSLFGYHSRMEKLFPDYCLVCDELLQVSLKNWKIFSDFSIELYQQIGFPLRFGEIGLYLGNYQKTPFGVHVDGCGVFSFPVYGTKKFRIWEPAYVEKNPELAETHEYSQFKKGSLLLTAKPGDMTYWPSSAWHIAESDGSFSATWSLGVWVDRPYEEIFKRTLESLFSKPFLENLSSTTLETKRLFQKDGSIHQLPKNFEQSIQTLRKLNPKDLQTEFSKSWLELVSLYGLKNLPVNSSTKKLSFRSKIQKKLPNPILWMKSPRAGQVLIAFNGKVFESRLSKNQRQLLLSLNEGKACRLGDFLQSPSDLSLFQKLHHEGCFQIN